jgi:hypothetical protein
MELSYTWTHPLTGTAEDVRQRIDVVSKPSNLGRRDRALLPLPQNWQSL